MKGYEARDLRGASSRLGRVILLLAISSAAPTGCGHATPVRRRPVETDRGAELLASLSGSKVCQEPPGSDLGEANVRRWIAGCAARATHTEIKLVSVIERARRLENGLLRSCLDRSLADLRSARGALRELSAASRLAGAAGRGAGRARRVVGAVSNNCSRAERAMKRALRCPTRMGASPTVVTVERPSDAPAL